MSTSEILDSILAALSKPHLEILRHTARRAPGGRFCGGSDTMTELVDMGLMKEAGRPDWVGDTFYTLTELGRRVEQHEKVRNERIKQGDGESDRKTGRATSG